jgi:hypothetical protein
LHLAIDRGDLLQIRDRRSHIVVSDPVELFTWHHEQGRAVTPDAVPYRSLPLDIGQRRIPAAAPACEVGSVDERKWTGVGDESTP